jgi:hypothetical protein
MSDVGGGGSICLGIRSFPILVSYFAGSLSSVPLWPGFRRGSNMGPPDTPPMPDVVGLRTESIPENTEKAIFSACGI